MVPKQKGNVPNLKFTKDAPTWDTLEVRSIMGIGLPYCSRQGSCCWGSISPGEWSLVGAMNLAFFRFFFFCEAFLLLWLNLLLCSSMQQKIQLKQNLIHSL